MELIRTENLTKRFGKITAVDNLNIHIPEGIAGFIGPNGAGKTTTIHMALGLLKPTNGHIYIFEEDPWSNREVICKNVGVLLENNSMPQKITARRYLLYVAKIRGLENPDKKVENVLSLLDLNWAKNIEIGAFSAGMKRRLGLAAAILGEPRFVILDEPAKSIDPLGRLKIFNLIKRLNKESRINFLLSSHVLPELELISNWIIIIHRGRELIQGWLNELIKRYPPKTYVISVDKPNRLLEELKSTGFTKEVHLENANIIVKVTEPEKLYIELPTLVNKHDLRLMKFGPLYGGLMEVYKNVIEREV